MNTVHSGKYCYSCSTTAGLVISRSALGQLALGCGSWAALQPLTTGDLFLALGDVVQVLASDGLAGVRLSFGGRTCSNWLVEAANVLLCFGNFGDGR